MALRWNGGPEIEIKPEACRECEGCGYVPVLDPERLVKQCPTCKGSGVQREAA